MAPSVSSSAEDGPSNWSEASRHPCSQSLNQSLDPLGSYPPAQLQSPFLKVRFSNESAGPSMAKASGEDSSVSPRTSPLNPASSNPAAIHLPPPILKVRFSNESVAEASTTRDRATSKPRNLAIPLPSWATRTPSEPIYDTSSFPRHLRIISTIPTESHRPEMKKPPAQKKTSGGSSSTRSSADRKGKQKANDSHYPSLVTLNSERSTPSPLKPIDSILTVDEMEKHPCTPGDYTTYRQRDEDDLRHLYVEMRKVGFNMPYAPFEPEYVAMKYYTAKPQPYKLQVSSLGFFVCWWAAIGGILSYRVWAMHVGYSKEWHWASLHQDLRFDDREWKLFVGSAGTLVISFAGVTATCLLKFGKMWWMDLIALGVFKACQVLKQFRKVGVKGRWEVLGESQVEEGRGESEQEKCRGGWKWDIEWEEEMIQTYRKRIWIGVVLSFMLFPLALLSAYVVVLMQKDKCFAHDKTGGFGW
ncbi:hypothetical protein BGX38DRAFT_786246 [Terfezia claveryi]|nr:hypothetical protein BGX38DRAFT_786246 [Terfezia claveryi]